MSLHAALHKLKSGETAAVTANGKSFEVTYHASQSYGDNNKPVRGATTGTYSVKHPDGTTSRHYHGPHANTELAAKRGANPNARQYAAGEAVDAITSKARRTAHFNDRR